MIPKELLSEIYGKSVASYKMRDNHLKISLDGQNHWDDLNLDTLCRLAKEWAITKNHHLATQSFTNPNYTLNSTTEALKAMKGEKLSTLYQCKVKHLTGWEMWVCSDKTELEAVLKACTWILENEQ